MEATRPVTAEDVAKATAEEPIPRKNSYFPPSESDIERLKRQESEEEEGGFCSQTIHAFAEAFTAHGIHYIFERGASFASKFFWVIVVVLFSIFAGFSMKQAIEDFNNNPILTSVKNTGLSITKIKYPTIVICGQGSNNVVPQSATNQRIIEEANFTKFTGAQFLYDQDTLMETNPEYLDEIIPLVMEYLKKYFPMKDGSEPDMEFIAKLLELMTTSNPDAKISATVATEGGYNPCEGQSIGQTTITCVEEGWTQNPNAPYCYKYEEDPENCHADPLAFYYDSGVSGLLSLLKTGSMTVPEGLWFSLGAERNDVNEWTFYETVELKDFTLIKITHDDPDEKCLRAKWSSSLDYLEAQSYDCQSYDYGYAEICQEYGKETVQCETGNTRKKRQDDPFGKQPPLELMLSPQLKSKFEREFNLLRDWFLEGFDKINIRQWYDGIFNSLWYNKNPCFDVKDTTSIRDGQWSLLKHCRWKGVKMPCSAIFNTFPTDRGMCCAFNMQSADRIFKKSRYVELIKQLQKTDMKKSFENTALPKWYIDGAEPVATPGINKGLSVLLDLHSDAISTASVNEDFQGFIGYVAAGDSFPLTTKKGFALRPGHENRVSIQAVDIDTATDTESISAEKRNCHFHDEIQLKMHVNYTQANCKLECALAYAQNVSGILCTPWYFPTRPDQPLQMCNPWDAVLFDRLMFHDIPDNQCKHCLPDCSGTQYHTRVTTTPFRRCDTKNLGVSFLCNLNDWSLPEPRIWGQQVLDEFEGTNNGQIPPYIKDFVTPSNRKFRNPSSEEPDLFPTLNQIDGDYKAYEKDIALVHFYFDSSTIFQYSRERRFTFVSLISQIGGVLGLFLGFSLVSIVELIYWFLFGLLCGSKKKEARQTRPATAANLMNQGQHSRYKKQPFYLN